MPHDITIRPAILEDAGIILTFIRDLAAYEKLSDQVQATEAEVVWLATTRDGFDHIRSKKGQPQQSNARRIF